MSNPGRQFNSAVTQFWSIASPLYDLPFLQRWVYRPAQDDVVAELRDHGAARIADVGCGTGILAARIAAELHPEQVHGVDMSDGMLEQAKARSRSVTWTKGPAERLPFGDDSLDAVVSTSAFHWFDQPAAMREFYRVLVPGGVAAVATISPPPGKVFEVLSRESSGVAHSPSPAQMRRLFTDAGFTVTSQRRVNRPIWTPVWDVVTVGTKARD
jgi:ubiquinone/menaquinone biosynthesis C-methylase UbiE